MSKALQLDAMSRAEKLRALQAIWHDLNRSELDIKSSHRHGRGLKARQARIKSGKEQAVDWEIVKKHLRGGRT
jgi:putative addiction module component (TIGR02574 family)